MSLDFDREPQRDPPSGRTPSPTAVRDAEAAFRRFADSADPEAFAEVVAEHRTMVLGVCRRVLGDAASAEDAAQETFVALARHARSVRTSLGAWLYASALNQARMALRSESRRRHREELAASGQEPAQAGPGLGDEECALLNRCIAALDDRDRLVVVQHFFLGLTVQAIAEREGVSGAAVRKRLDRALGNLRWQVVGRGLSGADLDRDRGEGALALVPVLDPGCLAAFGCLAALRATALATRGGGAGNDLGSRLSATAVAAAQTRPGFLAGTASSTFRPSTRRDRLQVAADVLVDAGAVCAGLARLVGRLAGAFGRVRRMQGA